MPHLQRMIGIACCVLFSALSGLADEKPRVSLTVAKKTITPPVGKTSSGEERGRMQTLVVAVGNLSIAALPGGTVRWTAVVRKVYGGSSKYSGTAVLKPLRSFKSEEMQCGAIEIDTRQGATAVERDRLDYEVVVFHNEKESARVASVTNFAMLADKAEDVTTQNEVTAPNIAATRKDPDRKKAKEEKPAEIPLVAAEKMMPPKPVAPILEISKPLTEPPPESQPPFDFFNLGGKKDSGAK